LLDAEASRIWNANLAALCMTVTDILSFSEILIPTLEQWQLEYTNILECHMDASLTNETVKFVNEKHVKSK
jgi:hypothetical protein